MSEYLIIVRGALVAIFLAMVMDDADITNIKWWVAMLSLNGVLAI